MDFASLRRRHGVKLVAALLIGAAYAAARLPELSSAERGALAARFAFEPHPLAEVPGGGTARDERVLSKKWKHISAYLSAFGGAGVALTDLDNRGLPDDVCLVDPRTDRVLVMPAPTTPERYKPFELRAALPAGVDADTIAPTGCLPGDYNEDGSMDLLVYYFGRPPVVFLRKPGVPLSPEAFVAQDVAPPTQRWNTMTATLADLDGDGHLDVVIGNYYADNAVILGAKVTGAERLYDSLSNDYNGGTKHVLLWQGATAGDHPSVQFKDVTDAFPEVAQHSWTLAVAAVDLDGDQLPELYLANDQGADRMLKNRSTPGHLAFDLASGVRHFTTPRSKVVGHDSFHGMGAAFADLSGHGLLDLFVSNITVNIGLHESHFAFINNGHPEQLSQGIAPFDDQSEPLGLSRSGWAWDARVADFDNGGSMQVMQALGFVRGEINRVPEMHELTLANDAMLANPDNWAHFLKGDDIAGQGPNAFFARAGDGRFYDIGGDLKLNEPGVSRGLALGDITGDGRLSFVVANQWAPSTLYKNVAPHPGAFLALNLRLPIHAADLAKVVVRPGPGDAGVLGRPAVGAVVHVTTPPGRNAVAFVDGGNGHSGKSSPAVHFGLGDLAGDTPLKVTVDWRDAAGTPHRESFETTPGWHTVWLGAPLEQSAMNRGGQP